MLLKTEYFACYTSCVGSLGGPLSTLPHSPELRVFDRLTSVVSRYEEIEQLLGQPEIASDADQLGKLAKERADLEPIVVAYRGYDRISKRA